MSRHLMAKMRRLSVEDGSRWDHPFPEHVLHPNRSMGASIGRGITWHQNYRDDGMEYDDWDPEGYGLDDIPESIELDWRDGPDHVLPHVRRQINRYNANPRKPVRDEETHWSPTTTSTAIRHHGETRYGLDVHELGHHFPVPGEPGPDEEWPWYWRIHRQVGPDETNPEHWEEIPVPEEDRPMRYEVGQVAPSPEHAKTYAERALRHHLDRQGQSRPALGDYDIDDIMRGEP